MTPGGLSLVVNPRPQTKQKRLEKMFQNLQRVVANLVEREKPKTKANARVKGEWRMPQPHVLVQPFSVYFVTKRDIERCWR